MIDLPGVTLWASVWSRDVNYIIRTLRVLRWCKAQFNCERMLFFSHDPVTEFEWIPIPCDSAQQWLRWANSEIAGHIKSKHALQVHQDGFPIHPELWTNEFLDYDYIGAPWVNGVVGNGGFCMESKRLMDRKLTLNPRPTNDNHICYTHRPTLEAEGIKFAPYDVALRFATEIIEQDKLAFGFHGELVNPKKFAEGWAKIEAWEKDHA